MELPYLSMSALAVPPWFYVLAGVASIPVLLSLKLKGKHEEALVRAACGLLFVDVLALVLMLWGVGVLLFPFYNRVVPAA